MSYQNCVYYKLGKLERARLLSLNMGMECLRPDNFLDIQCSAKFFRCTPLRHDTFDPLIVARTVINSFRETFVDYLISTALIMCYENVIQIHWLVTYVNSCSDPIVNSWPAPQHSLCNRAARSKYDLADTQSAIFLYTNPRLCSVLAELGWSIPNSRS